MLTQEKLTDPSASFMQTMMSLFFTDEVTPYSGRKEVEALPPMETMVLGLMCLERTYNSEHFPNRLRFKYRSFSPRECGIFTEVGILGLVQRGYLRLASKRAETALNARDENVWGLGNVPFVVTAKGARRIGYLVADLRGGLYKDVVKELQAESREAAKSWWADVHVSMLG
ncbi:hypothetical protein [Pandoraea oxalativorans]|uniref:Uncharacterized protein n=1 Tax=Pandoraea oxalativorans TaxID=573737 RepID=A0A0E3YA99_9BURK|nr:hypothetical protein [Pandoraea oxalativorans]AKC68545.1 hypothetical protein MB84_02405 [Pandoraea oxalativorans]